MEIPSENSIIKNHLPTKIVKPKLLIKNKVYCNVECKWLMMVYIISNFSPVSVELLLYGKNKYGKCTEENIQEVRPDDTDDFDTSKYRKFKVVMYGTEDYINFRKESTEKYCFPPIVNNLQIRANFDLSIIDFSHFQIEYLPEYNHGTKYSGDDSWDIITLKKDKKIALRLSGNSIRGISEDFTGKDGEDKLNYWIHSIRERKR